ncbi:MAG: efflux RND transporter periplasmic adaptor subunit [Gammaproteobacteria bacterium]
MFSKIVFSRSVRVLVVGLWVLMTPELRAESSFATHTVAVKEVSELRVLDGVVEAVTESTVSARTSGTIAEIYFDVNDYVRKGTVLLRLSDTEQKANLSQAEAGLAEARARGTEANSEYKRAQRMFKEKLIAESGMDKATAARQSARARLDAAEAGVRQAREQLDRTVVRAPYSGIVRTRHVQEGEVAQPGTPLMTGISLEDLRVAADVPQDLVNLVRDSGRVTVTIPGQKAAAVAERLTFFPYANPVTHSFRVRAYLPTSVSGLYPGMYVKMSFAVGFRQTLAIPSEAAVRRGEITGVYVVGEDDDVRLRFLRFGKVLEDGSIEVLAGLSAGERIALDPIAAGVRRKEVQ